MSRRLTALVVAGGLAVGLTACTGPSPTSGPSLARSGSTTSASSPGRSPEAPVTAPAPAPGTPAAVAWEALMGPDGEYMSAAQYGAVIEAFGDVQPYVNIRAAEERHANALTRQLQRFGVVPPANPYLGQVRAPGTLEAAARAWAVGEVANVEMYDALLTRTTDPGLVRVLTNLRRASEEAHLPMFEAAADHGGSLTDEQLAELGFGGGH